MNQDQALREAVEHGARALFCHHEGFPPTQMYSDTVNFWFRSQAEDEKAVVDDLRAQVSAVLAALSNPLGGGGFGSSVAQKGGSRAAPVKSDGLCKSEEEEDRLRDDEAWFFDMDGKP